MIFISHRGNLDGVLHERENAPEYIDNALRCGFDCEIDLRMKDGVPHLGHDTADHRISARWIHERKDSLWIHVKEYGALVWLMDYCPQAKFFCHEADRYTLVSNRWIWSHDLSNQMTDRCVIPLLTKDSVWDYKGVGFGAVCSDYIHNCTRKFKEEGQDIK